MAEGHEVIAMTRRVGVRDSPSPPPWRGEEDAAWQYLQNTEHTEIRENTWPRSKESAVKSSSYLCGLALCTQLWCTLQTD
jgi:hypothetical protein